VVDATFLTKCLFWMDPVVPRLDSCWNQYTSSKRISLEWYCWELCIELCIQLIVLSNHWISCFQNDLERFFSFLGGKTNT